MFHYKLCNLAGPVPKQLKAEKIAHNSVTFTFSLPEQLEYTDFVQEYKVVFYPVPNEHMIHIVTYRAPPHPKSSSHRFTVTGLTPSTTLTFKVAVVTSRITGGTGPLSDGVNVTTRSYSG